MAACAASTRRVSRRAFVRDGALVLAAPAALCACATRRATAARPLRIGVLTDVHYADKDPAGSRHYRDSLDKLRSAVAALDRLDVDVAVETGDFIDSAGDSIEREIAYLETIDAEYARLDAPRSYVLGNHCVHTLTKDEFIAHSGMETPHWSADHRGVHLVGLDACFRSDGVAYQRKNFDWRDPFVPPDQLAWLERDLAGARGPVVVFVHQRLDDTVTHSVRNAADVRAVLERAGNVVAVFQGHSHENEHVEVNGIHYCVIRAMVEGPGPDHSGYAMIRVDPAGSVVVDGFARQTDYAF
jgi:alkaline phosphatase